jgi:repressor LexA
MPDFSHLTERQREIYDFIRSKIEGRGFGPTVREIGEAFKIQSPNGVMCHLKALEKKGLIKRTPNAARAIELIDHPFGARGLPLLGKVAAGTPIEAVAIAEEEKLDINRMFEGPEHFLLQVRGSSMIEDHIEDGDYVVIRKQESAANGERVVVMVDGETTLKKFYHDGQHVRLEPANDSMEPIVLDSTSNAQVLGSLVGVVRKL